MRVIGMKGRLDLITTGEKPIPGFNKDHYHSNLNYIDSMFLWCGLA